MNRILLPHWIMALHAYTPNKFKLSNIDYEGNVWLSQSNDECYMLLFSGADSNFFGTCKNSFWTWKEMVACERADLMVIRYE